jgi:diguanylate cyclase
MRYRETKEQSSEWLRLALPLMARQGAAHHPVSYSLWYEHVAGLNPALSEVLNRRLQGSEPLTEDDTYRLHARFISARDIVFLEGLHRRLKDLLNNTAQQATLASEQTGRFGRVLGQSRCDIADAVSLEGVRYVIDSLLSETQRMEADSHELAQMLEVTATEVRVLTELLERAQTEAVIDPLCGLNNRRGFERAAQEITGPMGEVTGAALLLADIDHFKQVNDTYGHLLGDKVLRSLAQILRENIKGRDVAARIGGEEFAVLLPETTLEGARAVAEQLRAAMAKGRIHQGGGCSVVGSITLSIGIAVAKPGEPFERLMERADLAMYAAKREGRNRVCVAE